MNNVVDTLKNALNGFDVQVSLNGATRGLEVAIVCSFKNTQPDQIYQELKNKLLETNIMSELVCDLYSARKKIEEYEKYKNFYELDYNMKHGKKNDVL